MRKRAVCAPMISLCLLLAACGGEGAGNADQLALDIRAEYLAMEGCTARMDLVADYGERVYEYTMDLSYEKEGGTTLTVVSPEEIAGVTARISGEGASLEYDGVSLETGPLDGQGLSPVGAVPALLDYAMSGFIAETVLEPVGETECLKILCRDPEAQPGVGTEAELWFDASTHALTQGAISSDGAQVILCTFTDFQSLPQG